jgi:hypothetical protein
MQVLQQLFWIFCTPDSFLDSTYLPTYGSAALCWALAAF